MNSIGPKMVDLVTTQVPGHLEGRGLGRRLAEAALTHCEANGLRARTSCWFVKMHADKTRPRFSRVVVAEE